MATQITIPKSDIGTIPAHGVAYANVNFPGAATTNVVCASPVVPEDIICVAYVIQANTIRFHIHNPLTGPVTPEAMTFNVTLR